MIKDSISKNKKNILIVIIGVIIVGIISSVVFLLSRNSEEDARDNLSTILEKVSRDKNFVS